MRRTLARLATRFRPDDEEFVMRAVASPAPLSSADAVRVAWLFHAGAPDPRYVPWHATTRLLLCNTRWSAPRMLDGGDVFVSVPVDAGSEEGGSSVDGVAMIDAYAQKQLETIGNLGLRLTGADGAGSRELLLAERLKDASRGIKLERTIRACFERQERVPMQDHKFFVPVTGDEDATAAATPDAPDSGNDGEARVLMLPGGRLPLFCSRDRMLHSVVRRDVSGLRATAADVAALAAAQPQHCASFALALGWTDGIIIEGLPMFRAIFQRPD